MLLHWDYPDAYCDRVAVAMKLALDLATCVGLLEGRAVDPCRLDRVEVEKAKQASLVQLVRPLEVLALEAAA